MKSQTRRPTGWIWKVMLQGKVIRERPLPGLANHLALQHHFPNEVPDTAPNRVDMEVGVLLGAKHRSPDLAESPPEAVRRCCQQHQEHSSFRPGELDKVWRT